jgi:hypothetical protein
MEDGDGIFLALEGFVKNCLIKLLPPKVEFGDIILKGSNFEHYLFMKKDKLAHGTIFLNLIDFLLHHVAHVGTIKDAWDNLYTTFERRHVGNKLPLHQEFYNLTIEEGTLVQAHIDKLKMIAN